MLLSLTKKRWTDGLCLFVLILAFPYLSFAQNYDNPGGTITTCAGNFNDSGGSGGTYADDELITTSICPSIPGECVSVNFNSFDLENNFDFLYINQGLNTGTGTALAYTGANSPGTVSAYNASGCLTFIFTSDGSVSNNGWTSSISCGTCGTAPPASSADCIGAIPICTNTISVPSLSNGEGTFPNEYNASDPNMCLDTESQSTWYIFTANATGDFGFELTPNNATDDFDWAVFDLSNASCSDIFNNTSSLLVSCNASGGVALDPNACSGTTGANGGSAFANQGAGCNSCPPTPIQGCSTLNALIPVTTGNTYVLYVSNWSGSGNGYALDFSQSTVGIIDVDPPTLDLVYQPIACGATEITFEFSENVVCSSVQTSDFSLIGPGGPYTITNISNPDCDSGSNFGKVFTATINPPLTSNGTYSLSVIDDVVDNCGNITPSNTLTFDITNLTDASFSYDSPSYCSSEADPTPTIVIAGGTFSASPAGLVINTSTGIVDLDLSAQGTYTVTYEVTDGGCTAMQTQQITISSDLLPSIIANPTTLNCSTPTTSLDSGTGYDTYNWSNGISNQTTTVSSAGIYTVTVSDNGCMGTASIVITEDNTPPLTNISAPTTGLTCNTTSILLDAGVGFSAYVWSNGGNTQTTTVSSQGTYTVTITDASNGCTATASIAITQNIAPPSVNISASVSELTCNAPIAILDAGAGFGSYSWSNGGNTQTTTVSSQGTYTVTVTDNSNGCTAIASIIIIENIASPSTTITTSITELTCANPTAILDAGAGFTTYLWSNGGNAQTTTVNNQGTYMVTITDNSGCTGTASIVITQDTNIPSVSISASDPELNCNTNSIILDAGVGFDSYTWSTFTNTQTISITSQGTYTVTVTDNSSGCTNTATISITEDTTPPTVSITSPTTVLNCDIASIALDAGAGFSSYEWSNSGNTQTITISNSGTYTVIVTDTNNGCTNTTSIIITEDSTPPSPSISATTTEINCDNPAIVLDAGVGFSIYEWSNSANTQTIPVTSQGTYTVTVTDPNNGCTGTASIIILEDLLPPSTTISAISTQLNCSNSSITLDAGAGFAAYDWSNGGNAQTTSVSSQGTYIVTITSADNGCTATTSIDITEDITPPTALITPSSNISFCQGEDVDLVASGGITYQWSNGLGSSPAVTVNASGTYTVTVTGSNNCTSVSSVTVAQYNPIQILNFTETCNASNTAYTISFDIIGGSGIYTVNGNSSSSSYTSNLINSSTSYSITVDDFSSCDPIILAGTYSCISGSCFSGTGCTGPNLITNGDFEAGNTGFTSDYDYSPCPGSVCQNGLLCQYDYAIETAPNACNGDFSNNITDHTSGSGNMMVLDYPSGDVSPNNHIWCQTVTVTPDTDYCFGAYFINLLNAGSNQPQPLIQFTVDGLEIGTTTSLPETEQWIFEGFQFNSNTSISVDICILNANFGNVGYDLAIDDISLKETNQGNPPTVLDDSIEVCPEENNIVIDVLDNDISLLGLDLTSFAIESAPPFSEGAITDINATNGTITFSPSANFSGNVSFTYTICDNFGCCDVATVSVLESTPPNINATVFDLTCIASGSIDLMVTAGLPPYSYDWSNNTYDNQEDITAPIGTYTVTVTDANGCTNSNTFTILEDLNPPTVDLSSLGTELSCDTTSIMLDASNSVGQNVISYEWSDGSSNATLAVSSVGTYTVIITDSKNGCTASTQLTITEDVSPPTANITSLDTELTCILTSTILDASSSMGQGSISYEWSDASSNSTLIVNAPDTYTVTITDAQNGCTSSAQIIVTENITAPVANITSLATELNCTITDITLDASPSTGQGTISYEWSDASTNSTILINSPGTYSVTVTDSQNGCTDSQEINISEDITQPIAQIIPSETEFNCLINSMNLDASGSTGTNLPYEWQDGSTNSSLTIVTAGVYTVIVTDGNTGCTDSMSITINLNNTAPVVAILPTDPILTCDLPCTNLSVEFIGITSYGGCIWNNGSTTDTITVCSPGTYSVTVTDGSNGCTSTASVIVTEQTTSPILTITSSATDFDCNNPTITVNAAGTTGSTYEWSTGETGASIIINTPDTYAVTATDSSNGCTSADNITIGGITVTMPVITGNLGICNSESTILDATTTGISSYTWSTGESSTSISVDMPGEYTVTVSDGTCTETASVIVVQNASPSTSITGDALICAGSSTILDAGVGFNTYNWSNGDTNQTITVTNAGIYVVTITNAEGCEGTADFQVNINPVPIYNVIADTSICNGGSINLGIVISQGTSYSWTSNPTDPSLTNINIGTPSATPSQTTTYTLTATNGICSETSSVTVTVGDPVVLADDTSICQGEFATLSATGTPIGGTFTWVDVQGVEIGTGENIQVDPSFSSPYLVTYTIGDCEASTLVEVDVITNPGIAISASDTDIFAGEDLTLEIDNLPSGSNVEWSTNTGNDFTGESIITNPLENTLYTVEITSPNGCIYTDEIFINVTVLDTEIPNIFTPNGDDLNDNFYIINPGFSNKIVEFKIFDRWGTLIHNAPNTPWDGTFKGKDMPSDIYVYLFRIQSANGTEEFLKGDVALMR